MKIKNSTVESTPFTVVKIFNGEKEIAEIRQYWTSSKGVYGYQVADQQWLLKEGSTNEFDFSESKTNGCGYCKKSQSFEWFMHSVCKRYAPQCRPTHADADWLSRGTNAHKGGNYYEFQLSELVEYYTK
ncbi:MAG: hypothetical protein ACOVOV_17890 [Dolichospermum sp.]